MARDAPDLLEQLVARDGLARPLVQQAHELDLVERQRVRLALAHELVALRIDDGGPDVDLVRGRGHPGAALQAPEDRADAGHELAHGEGLRDVVVGAHLEPADLVALLRARRQHDDGHERAAGPDLLAHGEAVHVGQHEVEEHEIGAALARELDAVAAQPRRDDVEALELERVAQPAHEVRLVLDDEDAAASRRQRRPARAAAHEAARASAPGVTSGAPGTKTVNVAPSPGALVSVTRPPWASAMCLTSDRPMPLPRTLRMRAFVAR